jgi:hypothetical protein
MNNDEQSEEEDSQSSAEEKRALREAIRADIVRHVIIASVVCGGIALMMISVIAVGYYKYVILDSANTATENISLTSDLSPFEETSGLDPFSSF